MTDNIVFITTRNHMTKGIKTFDNLQPLKEFLDKNSVFGYDREASDLCPYRAVRLLTSIGNTEIQFVVDETCFNLAELLSNYPNSLMIGHNIKYDWKLLAVDGYRHYKVWDTMIAEQNLVRGSGERNGLDATLMRRFGVYMSKSTRKDFYTMGKNSLFTNEHIEYSAGDIKYMLPLYEKQQQLLTSYGMLEYVRDTDIKIVPIIGEAEIEGIKINEPKLRATINNIKKEIDGLEISMDNEILNLESLGYDISAIKMKVKNRRKEDLIQTSLFGDSKEITNSSARHLNYNSQPVIFSIFDIIGTGRPSGQVKNAITKKKETKESIREDILVQWKLRNKKSPLVKFVDYLLEYKGRQKLVSSFGSKFYNEFIHKKGKSREPGYKNPITGKVHTSYNISPTETGRMSSGDGKGEKGVVKKSAYFNSQQIPKEPKEIRESFCTDEGYEIATIDLTGAELVILAALANDPVLIKLVSGDDPDPHSPLATIAYTAVIEFIKNTNYNDEAEKELAFVLKCNIQSKKVGDDVVNLSDKDRKEITRLRVKEALDCNFKVTKKETSDMRDSFKNIVYGLAYGASAERIMEILGFPKIYAEIIEKALKRHLPATFKYLDDNSKNGINNGWVVFNSRSNGRRYFKPVLDFKRGITTEIPFGLKGGIERESKNTPIQGTQANMIKEGIRDYFFNYVYPNNLQDVIKPLLFVHDEVVLKYPEGQIYHAMELKKCLTVAADRYLLGRVEMKAGINKEPLKHWTK